MQTIEINTAQNVRIEYELAGLSARIFAFTIDFAVIILSYLIFVIGFAASFSVDASSKIIVEVFGFIWIGFYSLFSEVIGNGQTIGKRAMGIKVIKLNGEELEFYDYFSRWSMRLVDIYFSLGSVAILLIAGNKNGQRIGDIIAGTTIIRKRSSYGFSLDDILKLNQKNKEDYNFSFPMAATLEEKDVILIKNLLHRKRLYDNKAHQMALDKLVNKLVAVLQLESMPKNKEEFLIKIISEYIILTR